MNTVDIITKKRNNLALTEEEIEYLINGYTEGTIPDYQMSAFLMAVYFNGMNHNETVALTKTMLHSGDIINFDGIEGVIVDKHSTGGVGDKTTLIVGPIAAACGVPIAKMSGRGLGFTGGTVDKLEAISGYKTSMDQKAVINQVNNIGISLIGQTGKIAPADKKIYALRDVTGTVENLSLITSSIMSKKLASGSDAIVLDVKCGSGAFMKTKEEASELARLMVEIGKANGKKTMALITDMNQPLGNAVGNALEVIEAIETLKGNGPEDITKLSIKLAGFMIYAGEKAKTPQEGEEMAIESIKSGSALKKLGQLISAQGGDERVLYDYSLMPESSHVYEYKANADGYIINIDAMGIGQASQHTGAGRATKDDKLDLGAGIYLHKKIGDIVKKGDIIARIYTSLDDISSIMDQLDAAIEIGSEKREPEELIKASFV